MFKEEILANENRRKIYAIIQATPGIHFRELQRQLDMPLATLEYHLSYMVRKKIIFAEKEGYFRRFYTKPLGTADKRVLLALRQRKMREIVLFILSNEKAKFQLLQDELNLPTSTLSFYLKYLVENSILVREKIGYETIYTIRDEDQVAKVLTAYKSSLLDKLVDKALTAWLETYNGKDEF
jgi:predicted transcriptional regulator